MKKPIILTLAFLLISALSGCRGRALRPDAQYELREAFPGVVKATAPNLVRGRRGGTFIRADIRDYDTFNIATTRSQSLYAVLKLVFEGLLRVHPVNGTIEGCIAKNYSLAHNGTSLVIHLNENVFFSDGTPCTADDVMFTFEEIYLNPDVDTKKTDLLKIRDSLVGLEKIDMHTIRFDLPVPYRPFLYTLAHIEILPKHIVDPIISSGGIEAFNSEWGNMQNGIGSVIGTGPYYIKEYAKGRYIRLARNPYYSIREGGEYYEGMPYLDEIIELLDIDNDAVLLKFQIGEIDFYDVKDIDISSGDFETLLSTRADGNYRIYSAGQTLKSNHFLVFNQNRDVVDSEKLLIFQSAVFRRAVSSLIDRNLIRETVYRGYSYIEGSPERSCSPFYTPVTPLEYDPQKAREYISRLGLSDRNGDGFVDFASGEPFTFSILTNEDNPFRIKMGNVITERMREAGIDAHFSSIGYDSIVTKLLDTFEWDAVIIGFEGSIEPNDESWIWESKGPLHIWAPYGQRPQTPWEQRIDELFALGRTEWDYGTAKEYYEEYQHIAARELPIIPITVPAELYGFRKGFGNILPSPVTYNSVGLMPYIFRTDQE
jgi:peptide/nickel transport system substrate-binding protein